MDRPQNCIYRPQKFTCRPVDPWFEHVFFTAYGLIWPFLTAVWLLSIAPKLALPSQLQSVYYDALLTPTPHSCIG